MRSLGMAIAALIVTACTSSPGLRDIGYPGEILSFDEPVMIGSEKFEQARLVMDTNIRVMPTAGGTPKTLSFSASADIAVSPAPDGEAWTMRLESARITDSDGSEEINKIQRQMDREKGSSFKFVRACSKRR